MGKLKNITINADSVGEAVEKLNGAFKKNLEEGNEAVKPVLITEASIKEELCNYSYEINIGPGTGDKVKRKGSAMVHNDMDTAFAVLNKHLAHIDDTFTNLKKEPKTMLELQSFPDIINNFKVTGFKISGNDENEGFILLGDKYVNQGCIGLETPKISISSGYQFFDDLKDDIEACRNEVELYMNGKCTPKMEQGELDFAADTSDGKEFDNPID